MTEKTNQDAVGLPQRDCAISLFDLWLLYLGRDDVTGKMIKCDSKSASKYGLVQSNQKK